jgi:hypothetical protein
MTTRLFTASCSRPRRRNGPLEPYSWSSLGPIAAPDYAMVLRYAHLAPSHLAAYAENACVTGHKPVTHGRLCAAQNLRFLRVVGRAGIEPATNGLIWLPLSRGRENFCLPSIVGTNRAR